MAPERSQRRQPQDPKASRKKRRTPALALDPDLLGLLAGTLCATLVLLVDYFRYEARSGLHMQVVIGAGLTFVVSYAATGVFVWYLREVRERELAPEERHAHLETEQEPSSAAGTPPGTPSEMPQQETGEGG